MEFYTFSQSGLEVPASVPVSIDPAAKGALTVDIVRVRMRGLWRPGMEWLLHIVDSEILEKRGVGLAMQRWWKLRGASLRVKLPVELRLMVWEHIMGGRNEWTLSEAKGACWGRLIL
jgi:hypothetical protein